MIYLVGKEGQEWFFTSDAWPLKVSESGGEGGGLERSFKEGGQKIKLYLVFPTVTFSGVLSDPFRG